MKKFRYWSRRPKAFKEIRLIPILVLRHAGRGCALVKGDKNVANRLNAVSNKDHQKSASGGMSEPGTKALYSSNAFQHEDGIDTEQIIPMDDDDFKDF